MRLNRDGTTVRTPFRFALPAVLVLVAFAAALAALLMQPAATLDDASGLYSREAASPPFYWTSNRVQVPLRGRAGPTEVTLTLGPSTWPGRPSPAVTLATDEGQLAVVTAPEQLRRYTIVAPASAKLLTLETTLDRPPAGDRRWLGVMLYDLAAQPNGLPLAQAAAALGLALAALGLALAFVWAAQRGLGPEAALLAAGLGLGLAWLDRAPSGWRPDEVVSLVDAWSLAQTGRDHLGHLLPLGAFEAYGDWISPLLTYLELPIVALLGPQPFAGRLMTALFGALAAPLCYRLALALGLGAPGALCAGAVALSPWQIFLSRNGLPPALVPTCWALCLLAAVRLAQHGGRREALVFGLAAGLALYSYPTMKLAVPLLGALAAALTLARHGRPALRRCWPGALLAGALWLPFVCVTLFNPASSTRLDQAAIAAGSAAEWLAIWWRGYRVYFQPEFYYVAGDGNPIRGVPRYGAELLASAPLVLLGLLGLLGRTLGAGWQARRAPPGGDAPRRPAAEWWLVLGAAAIAPLPSSLTLPSPHNYRAATIAPLYALLAGLGAALLWSALARTPSRSARRAAQALVSAAFALTLAVQLGGWYRDYLTEYREQRELANQEGLFEAMRRLARLAPNYPEQWVSADEIIAPYSYLLAARPLPVAELQQQIVVMRSPGHFNAVTSIGSFKFVDPVDAGVPDRLPTLEAIPMRLGRAGFAIQRWDRGGQAILILRRME